MKIVNIVCGVVVAAAVTVAGLLLFPYLLADRIVSPTTLEGRQLFGVHAGDLAAVLAEVEPGLQSRTVPLEFRGKTSAATLASLGVSLDIPATTRAIFTAPVRWPWQARTLTPHLAVDETQLVQKVGELFRDKIETPQNASLVVSAAGAVRLSKSRAGETPDLAALLAGIEEQLRRPSDTPVAITVVTASPAVLDHEVASAQAAVAKLLASGLTLKFEDRTFTLSRIELAPMLEFGEQVDPQNPANRILGLRFESGKLRRHLENRLAGEINQAPVNAKFEAHTGDTPEEVRVTEFSAPRRGLTLNIESTTQVVMRTASAGLIEAPLVVDVVEPEIAKADDIEALGIRQLLARGESDFAGSPRNRVHNITVGAGRYHGLLIPPGEEFSFNANLGPVNAAAGFKPELVIKNNSTIPEFGGGLCQVSTTAFRAALFSGLEVTERRNHAYAVRYYGTPGFDATIYPGYTDLRFRNDTPGHILVQTKIEGTKLYFDFWGTPDGRAVEVEGPTPYNRRPDGAVKATLTQRVLRDSQPVMEKTFHSSYKSPDLYPKIIATSAEQPPNPTAAPQPTPGPKPSPKPIPTPAGDPA